MRNEIGKVLFDHFVASMQFMPNSSAALLRDGNLVAAAKEERFRRVKHWAGFPSEAIAFCLREAGVQLSDVDHIGVNQDNSASFLRKIRYILFQHQILISYGRSCETVALGRTSGPFG